MIAMRASLTKFADGGTAGWGVLQRNQEKVMEKWDAYDSNYQSLQEIAADVESVTEEQLRDEGRAHEAFQGELLILRDQALEVIDRGSEEAAARENARDEPGKLKLLGDRFKAAYNGIDAQLAEMRTFLADVDATHSFETLEYQMQAVGDA